jgi:hypothetical protein
MQRRHIQTSPQEQRIFFIPRLFVLYALGGSSHDIGKEALMFLVSIGKKPADGIDLLVLVFEMGPHNLSRAALFFRIIHVGMDFVIIGMDSVVIGMDSAVNISIKQHFQ